MPHLIRLAGCLAVSTLLAACATSSNLNVTSDYDKNIDFKSFRTYSLLEIKDEHLEHTQVRDPRIFRFIETAIRAEMDKRNYQEVESGEDIEIAYFVKSQVRTVGQEVGGVNVGVGFGGYYGGVGMSSRVGGRVEYTDYVEGTLIIDMHDPESKELIWHGAARGTMKDSYSIKTEQVVDDAVRKIMWKYKWKAGK